MQAVGREGCVGDRRPQKGAEGGPRPCRPPFERSGWKPGRPAHGPPPGPPVTHFPSSQWRGRLSPSPHPWRPRREGGRLGAQGAGVE